MLSVMVETKLRLKGDFMKATTYGEIYILVNKDTSTNLFVSQNFEEVLDYARKTTCRFQLQVWNSTGLVRYY